MESQNKSFCWNPPSNVPDQMPLNALLQWTIPQNWGVPSTTGPKVGSQATQVFEAFGVASIKIPSCPSSQVCPGEGVVKSSCFGVSSAEDFKLVEAKGASACYLHTLESADPIAGFKPCVKGDVDFSNNQNFVAWNGMLSEKFKAQASNTLQQRFVMFDQTGSRRRIIFHPNQIPTVLADSAEAMARKNGQTMDSDGTISFKLPVEGNSTDWDADFPAYRETIASAFAALQKMRTDRLNSVSLGNFGNELIACTGEEECISKGSCNGLSQSSAGRSQSQLHEDTEDLEALLISDDEESSTGHSPTDVTRNNGHCSTEEDSDEITSGMPVKRRRIEKEGYEEVQVKRTIPASIKEPAVKEGFNDWHHSSNVSLVDTGSWEPGFQHKQWDDCKDAEHKEKLINGFISGSSPQQSSSKGSANNGQNQMCNGHSGQLGSAVKAKKEKIKRTVRLLKSIIPGGDCMDTAIVLDEAIEYLKLLQVKVKKLEANQHD